MGKRTKSIKKYYINLGYDARNNQKALMKISTLSKEIKVNDVNNIKERCLEVKSVIEKNLIVFQSVCKHVDEITSIIELLYYLDNPNMKANRNGFIIPDRIRVKDYLNELWNGLYTLFNICTQLEIKLFLHAAIIKNSSLEDDDNYQQVYKSNYRKIILCQTTEMIILPDSDLHAAVEQLKITGIDLNKILVQEPVKEKFLSLLKIYFTHSFNHVQIFQTKEELFSLLDNKLDKIRIVSIWSEDITAAKSLAGSLNKDILFINTHMDFCGGIVIPPYRRLFEDPLHKSLLCSVQTVIQSGVNISNKDNSICNLFYDGTWQKQSWAHNDNVQWAKAAIKNTRKCIDSAEKGFKIWSTWSIDSRKEALSNLATELKVWGQSELTETIMLYLTFPYYNEEFLESTQNGRLEVVKTFEPRGVIILKYTDENTLFLELTQSLIMGNSVIIICNETNSYALKPYCDMFEICQIPPGVINVLSLEIESYPYLNIGELTQFTTIIYISKDKQIVLPLR